MAKKLMKGCEAIGEAAVHAGCRLFFGYPITPQNEILEWLSKRMPELGRAFVQAEAELGAINMVYGAACTGARIMTSSSSPGISLMMEGLSYIAGTEVPMLLVNVMRGGPGLGNIAPSQGDYNQICKGGGHGDYHPIVLAPSSVQEAVDLVPVAFDLAEKYLNIVCILIDGSIGQMMEPIQLPPMAEIQRRNFPWATDGVRKDRERRILTSIYLDPLDEEKTNLRLLKRWEQVQEKEIRYKEYFLDDAEIVVIGFGTAGRIALSAVRLARAQGIRVALFRPVTVSPYPYEKVAEIAKRVKTLLVVEMNGGQMLEDVRLAVNGNKPIEFYGRLGGVVPFPDEILAEIQRVAKSKSKIVDNPVKAWMQRMSAATK
jgi:2-oxoglutarate ferredoxin oxidoreductase subunit alpha